MASIRTYRLPLPHHVRPRAALSPRRHMLWQSPTTHTSHGRKGLFLAFGMWTGEDAGYTV